MLLSQFTYLERIEEGLGAREERIRMEKCHDSLRTWRKHCYNFCIQNYVIRDDCFRCVHHSFLVLPHKILQSLCQAVRICSLNSCELQVSCIIESVRPNVMGGANGLYSQIDFVVLDSGSQFVFVTERAGTTVLY